MTSLSTREWERLLEPLFRCHDCNGRGERWHAIWPKTEIKISETNVNEASFDYEPPRKVFKRCETCRGTGRWTVQTDR